MLTSGGPENRKADVHLRAFEESGYPDGWRRLVQSGPPRDDPAALVVRHERDGLVFATVFGELIDAEPGRLRLEFSRQPWGDGRGRPSNGETRRSRCRRLNRRATPTRR